jgi:hypothetical protein
MNRSRLAVKTSDAWPDHSQNAFHQDLGLMGFVEIGEYETLVPPSYSLEKDVTLLFED